MRSLMLLSLVAMSCGPTAMMPAPSCASDAECQDGVYCNGVERCAPGTPGADARGCVSSVLTCDEGLHCSEVLKACRPTCVTNFDCQDGLFCNGAEECRPTAPAADGIGCWRGSARPCLGPGNECIEARRVEIAFGLIRDVPGRCRMASNPSGRLPDGGCSDADNDGHPAASCGGDDCRDDDPRINPGVREVCDPGEVDEDCDACTVGEVTSNSRGGDADRDEDGFPSSQCANHAPTQAQCQLTSADGGLVGAVHVRVTKGSAGDFVTRGTDCDDTAANRNVTMAERCDGHDDDCNGLPDDGVTFTFFADVDRDGFGAGSPYQLCTGGSEYSPYGNDCDDTNPAVVPGAMVCVVTPTSGLGVRVCQADGGFFSTTCDVQRSCVTQPNGTGVCN